MYIRCRLFKPMSELSELYDKYFAFMIDQCDKRTKAIGFSMVYDVTDAGLSNVEMVSPKLKYSSIDMTLTTRLIVALKSNWQCLSLSAS